MTLGLALLLAWLAGIATAIALRWFCDRLREIQARRNALRNIEWVRSVGEAIRAENAKRTPIERARLLHAFNSKVTPIKRVG